MNETELEAMVVRMLGDGTSYQKMMLEAQATATQTGAHVAKVTSDIDGFGHHLSRFAEAAIGGLAIFGAEKFLKNAFDMFAETETLTVKLSAAIRANGGNVEATMNQYKDFAKTLKELTGASSDDTLSMLKRAEAFGLTGVAAQNAVRNAMNLGAGGDVDPESALRITAQLEQGHVRQAMQYARLVPALRGIRDEQEFVRKAQLLMNIGTEQQTALMNTSEGVMRRFHGTVKAITKQFGEYVADAVKPAVKWTTDLLAQFTKLDDQTKRLIAVTAFVVAGIMLIGPAVAVTASTAVPLLRMMQDGFGLVWQAIKLLANPIRLVTELYNVMGVAAHFALGPWAIVAAVATVAIALIVHELGGFKATWDKVKAWAFDAWAWVKVKGLEAWEYVKERAVAFLAWIQPAVDKATGLFNLAWRGTGVIIDWVKANFMTWVTTLDRAVFGVQGIAGAWENVKRYAGVAWDWVTAKTLAFLQWVKPIVAATMGVLAAGWEWVSYSAGVAWDLAVQYADSAWNAIKTGLDALLDVAGTTWEALFGDVEISWTAIKDFIVDQLILAEWKLRNFGDIAQWVWAGTKLGVVRLGAEIGHFFGVVVPAVLSYFATNWATTFRNAFEFASSGWTAVTRLMNGEISLTNFTASIAGAFNRAVANTPPLLIPQRTMSELEAQLQAEFDRQGQALGESFDAFRTRRLAEINAFEWPDLSPGERAVNEAVRNAAAAGQRIGGALNTGVEKEVHKFDAVLRYSREFLYRLEEYNAMLTKGAPQVGGAVGSGGNAIGANLPTFSPTAQASPAVAAPVDLTRVEALLTAIKDSNAIIAARPQINLIGAVFP